MDPEEEAKKSSGGNLEAVLRDRGASGLYRSHLPYIQSIPLGGQLPFHSNPVSLQQVGMNAAAPEKPTGSMGKRRDEEHDAAPPRRRNGPLSLLDLPTDVLKEILSQVRHYISSTRRSCC